PLPKAYRGRPCDAMQPSVPEKDFFSNAPALPFINNLNKSSLSHIVGLTLPVSIYAGLTSKMKRCPQCNRVETDLTLKFCRVDGATLVGDSSSFNSEAGTAQPGASPDASEVHTSILPHNTNANVKRATAPTTVLPAQPSPSTTSQLDKPKRKRTTIVITVALTSVVAAASAIFVESYRSRNSGKSIQSIAVMPFVNESGNADLEYLSDGMTETLIGSLSQLPNLSVKARSSVFRYKGKDTNAQTIGRELNVQAILNGRVIQRGDQLD